MKSLEQASEKIGIDLDGPHEFKGIKIEKGNANAMDCFPNERFDTVLCNATLEHDKYFWKTLAEIKRVAKPGALVVIGVPGYARFRAEKFSALLSRTPILRRLHLIPILICSSPAPSRSRFTIGPATTIGSAHKLFARYFSKACKTSKYAQSWRRRELSALVSSRQIRKPSGGHTRVTGSYLSGGGGQSTLAVKYDRFVDTFSPPFILVFGQMICPLAARPPLPCSFGNAHIAT